MEYGEYRFDNRFYVNPLISSESEVLLTVLHEGLHFMNASNTPYGLFIRLLYKANSIDDSKLFLIKKIAGYTHKSHEAISTFAEIVSLLNNKGKKETVFYIENLRENNEEYYNYIKQLLPLLNYAKEYSNGGTLPILTIFSIIKTLFELASNVDVFKIDYSIYQDESKLNKTLKNQKTYESFCPDVRFKKLVKRLCHILPQITDKDTETIFETLKQEFIDVIEQDEEDELLFLSRVLEQQRKLVIEIYQESPLINIIQQKLNSIDIKEVEPEYLLRRATPLVNEIKEVEGIIDANEINEIHTRTDCFFLILYRYSEENQESREVFDYMDILITEADYDKMLFVPHHYKCSEQEFIRWYTAKKDYIVHLALHYTLLGTIQIQNKNNLFIYCDKNYDDVKELIKTLSFQNKCTVIDFENSLLKALVIEISSHQFFILPFIGSLTKATIKNDIVDSNDDFQKLEVDELLMNDINFFLNSLYVLG